MLARVQEENFWLTLEHQRLGFLRTEVRPLFRTVSEVNFKAMRFERNLLEYSLARLCKEARQAETLREGIVTQISELLLAIRFVQEQEELIRTAQTAAY